MKKSFKLLGLAFALIFAITVKVNALEVAQINTTKYETLQEAINAAKVGETIKLVEDIDLQLGDGAIGFTVDVDDEIVLDLNGHAITGPGSAAKKSSHIIVNKGKLTIMDSSAEKSGKIEMSTTTEWNIGTQATPISNQGTLIVNSGTIANYRQTTTMAYAIDTNSSARAAKTVINGGVIYSDYCAMRAFNNGNKAEIEINGGEVKSINRPVFMQNFTTVPSVVKITGGKITSTEKDIFYIWDNTENKKDVVGVTNVSISGGIFSSALSTLTTLDTVEENNEDIANFDISGGTFSELTENLPLEEGSKLYEVLVGEGDPKYVVAKESELVDEVMTAKVDEKEIDKKEQELVEEAIAEKYTVLGYYDIDLGKFTPNDDLVGFTTETKEEITVTLEIPEELKAVEKGYVRNFAIIRIHDGKSDVLTATDNGDGTISFKTNKFSTYVLVYDDVVAETAPTNPPTYDGISTSIILGALSLIGLAAISLYIKNKKVFN